MKNSKTATAKVANTKKQATQPEKVSRTEMVKILKSNGGKFVTTTHLDKEGKFRTMNGPVRTKTVNELGYISIYSVQDHGIRMINPQTLYELKAEGRYMRTTSKPKASA